MSIPKLILLKMRTGMVFQTKLLLPNRFAYRQIAIKSPICVPSYLVRKIGYLNKKLAPYAHDDLEYGIRCYLAGYKNGVFAIKFRSDIKWGGTRNNAHPEMQKIINRNISNIKKWYKKELALMVKEPVKDKIYSHIVKTSKIQDKIAKEQWHNNKLQLTKYYSQNISLITKLFHFFSQKIHIIRYLSQKIISNLNEQYRRYLYLNHSGKPLTDYTFTESQQVFNSNIKKYYYYTQYTQQLLPKILLKHRKYFSQNNRGFGEDAFHAMWWLLFREYKPVNCLEIGV
ncbi:MAG: hypothetical protein LC127_18615, partial [Chitinophagales bacterium]|nr:hypothetical protein [Chitinophagales bacterium]